MPTFLNRNSDNNNYKCTVRLLDSVGEIECQFQAHHKGDYILDYTCNQLNLIEKDYFCLRYLDSDKQRQWLNPAKSVIKQIKVDESAVFSFRVKFYPQSPFQLKEQITRYQVYLQVKRDLLRGRLNCGSRNSALLGAYILQAELGDFNPDEHVGNYASHVKIFLKESLSVEHAMMEIHKTELRGQTTEEAEMNFLSKACTLDSYGIDPHQVKDQRGNHVYLGINFNGILVFQNNRKNSYYRWHDVRKINFEGKMFIVHVTYTEDLKVKRKETVGYKCPTVAACKYVWRCAIEQMLFYTSPSSSDVPKTVTGGGFITGSKFRYTGRVEREVLEEMAHLSRPEPKIIRIGSVRKKSSSVPATPSTPIVNETSTVCCGKFSGSPRLKFSTLKKRSNTEDIDYINSIPSEVGNSHFQSSSSGLVARGNWKGSQLDSIRLFEMERANQSSCESQLGCSSHRSSRSQTPVPRAPKGSVHFTPKTASKVNRKFDSYGRQIAFCSRVESCIRACLPSIFFTFLTLLIGVIIIFETDSQFLTLLRRSPEMVIFRRQVYEPVKSYFRYLVDEFFSNKKK